MGKWGSKSQEFLGKPRDPFMSSVDQGLCIPRQNLVPDILPLGFEKLPQSASDDSLLPSPGVFGGEIPGEYQCIFW